MILHSPGDRTIGADFGALNVGYCIGGEHRGAWRECLDLIEVHSRGVEYVKLASIHGMFAARFGQSYAAPETDFTSFRIFSHTTAGRRGNHLQTPARTEYRGTGFQCRAHQFDLAHTLRTAIVDMQARAGDGDAVIALQRGAFRQKRARIAWVADIYRRARQQLPQQ